MSIFTLTVATSADGYIARAIDDAPQSWASKEEQELFFRDVEAADWAIMGRNTHEAADKPYRRRVVFSTRVTGWQRPTQLWLDPCQYSPQRLADAVTQVAPLENGLILGGTRVHDWFLHHQAIHRVNLTIEPVEFGNGLPIFTKQGTHDPLTVFASRGFQIVSDTLLNDAGTRYIELTPGGNSVE